MYGFLYNMSIYLLFSLFSELSYVNRHFIHNTVLKQASLHALFTFSSFLRES